MSGKKSVTIAGLFLITYLALSMFLWHVKAQVVVDLKSDKYDAQGDGRTSDRGALRQALKKDQDNRAILGEFKKVQPATKR